MTYSELLHTVTFDEILPFIKKYNDGLECAAMYKMLYDRLCLLKPYREEGDDMIVTISNAELSEEEKEYGAEPHLIADSMEFDSWEVNLAKELVVEPDVVASLAEIAACCISQELYVLGFIEFKDPFFLFMEFCYENLLNVMMKLLDVNKEKKEARRYLQLIESYGGKIPRKQEMLSIPSFKKQLKEILRLCYGKLNALDNPCPKRKRIIRLVFMHLFRKRLLAAGRFIEYCLEDVVESEGASINELCQLLRANHVKYYSHYQSFTDDSTKRVPWLIELIDKYNAFGQGIYSNVMICVATSPEHLFTGEEHRLLQHIMEPCPGKKGYLVKNDDNLGKEIKLWVVFYE